MKKILILLIILLNISIVSADIIQFNSPSRLLIKTDIYKTNISNLQDSGISTFMYAFTIDESNNFTLATENFIVDGVITKEWFYTYANISFEDKITEEILWYDVKYVHWINDIYWIDYCWNHFSMTGKWNDITEARTLAGCSPTVLLDYDIYNHTFEIPKTLNITSTALNNVLQIVYIPYSEIEEHQIITQAKEAENLPFPFNILPWGLGYVVLYFLAFVNLTTKLFLIFAKQPYLLIMLFWTLAFPICINRTNTFFGLIREILEIHGKLISFIMNIVTKIFSGVINIIAVLKP